MVWLPDHIWAAKKGKGGGGGGWGKGGGGGVWKQQYDKSDSWLAGMLAQLVKGKGKGKGRGKGLQNFSADRKVWIGSLPEGVTWKQLQEHMNQAGTTKWCEVFGGASAGTGAVVYSSPEEAQAAIGVMNGSTLNGAAIVCDGWEKKEKPPAEQTA
mmetsp:Transcript_56560/g.104691  ORF Transcript_56560/g.104691 Transcript_56560/m.104691 type:complete len:155 (+) Transcript_56560:69-533(+)